MIILGIIFAVFVVGVVLVKTSKYPDTRELVGGLMIVFGTIVMIMSLLSALTVSDRSQKAASEYAVIAAHLKLLDQRADMRTRALARTIAQEKIKDINDEILAARKYNDTLLDIWFSDLTATLPTIKTAEDILLEEANVGGDG